jgi:DNA-directed RNA polymerase specialized sigma subunit
MNIKHYCDNDELLEELRKYKQSSKMSENLGMLILKIARNLSNKGNFAGYTWKDDMIGEAVLTCVKYLHNFDPEKSNNPFAYVTTCCKNAFITYIKAQHKHTIMKDVLYNVNGGRQYIADASVALDYTDFKS